MAIYELTVVTAKEPFGIRFTSNTERYQVLKRRDNGAIFKESTTRKIYVEDDDDTVQNGIKEKTETGQNLLKDFNFGYPEDPRTEDVIKAGTKLQLYTGQIIQDTDGNRFAAYFPMPFRPVNVIGAENLHDSTYGDKRSLILINLNKHKPKTEGQNTSTNISSYQIDLGENDQPIQSVFNKDAVFYDLGIASTSLNPQPYNSPTVQIEDIQFEKCFAEGSLLQTPAGLRAVETLRKGDLIQTHDNGIQPILWIGHTPVNHNRLTQFPNLLPIRISKGTLGSDFPDRDLIVSPQHRILIRSQIARRMFDCDEVLVAAKHLLEIPGIDVIHPENGINYWHILLPEHDMVLSHGTWTESLYLGPYTLQRMGKTARAELTAIFPELAEEGYTPRPARRLLTGKEGRKLAERHVKNNKLLVTSADCPRLQASEKENISAV